jgi:hypothetical protein
MIIDRLSLSLSLSRLRFLFQIFSGPVPGAFRVCLTDGGTLGSKELDSFERVFSTRDIPSPFNAYAVWPEGVGRDDLVRGYLGQKDRDVFLGEISYWER